MKVLIVGGASGIGFSLAKKLSYDNNNDVYIGVHKKNQIETIKKKINDNKINISVVKLDVRNKKDRKIINKINPDCLMIHDGIGNGGSILEMDIDVLRDNIETNVFANFTLLKEYYELKNKNNEPGKVFVTSSIAAYIPIPFLGCYTSSKAAITSLCKALRYELKYLNNNITISVIEPGAYHTGFNQVMTDNKELFSNKNGKIYKNINKINRIQRNLFRLVEKDDKSSLINKIIKEIYKKKPKFRIRKPLLQVIFLKLYLIFFG